jgi:mono/diheme cytochrome c family protein
MFTNLLIWLIIVIIAVAFGWLTRRAWKLKKSLLKWVGGTFSALFTLVLTLVSVVALIGIVKFYRPRSAPIPDVKVSASSEQIQRGQYLANSFCTGCHSPNGELPLVGGTDLAKDIPIPIGSFVSTNLTPGGSLKDWSDGEIFRALRNGIDPGGRGLVIMSNNRVRNMSDEDILAMIAYLRSQPAVENVTPNPPDQISMLGIVMLGAGQLPEGKPPINGVITAPPRGATADYGQFIVSYQDCRDCHGEDLTGGKKGQLAPIGPNLRVVRGWTQDQFLTTLQTGVDPSGNKLNPQMPWPMISRMDDNDLIAMYKYLASL